MPLFRGRYVFADFITQRVWSLQLVVSPTTGEATAGPVFDHTAELGGGAVLGSVSGLGVDAAGELYIINYSAGTILKLVSGNPQRRRASRSSDKLPPGSLRNRVRTSLLIRPHMAAPNGRFRQGLRWFSCQANWHTISGPRHGVGAAPNHSMTLAIVDDDENVRQALARLLRSLGHAVHVYGSAEAFEARAVAIDCLILDVRMPGLSGPELRERLRSRPTPTPVVLITGDSDPKARDMAPAIDTPLITKPFDEDTLMAAISRAIGSAAALGERHAQ